MDNKEFTITIPIPAGMDKNNIRLHLTKQALTIKAAKRAEQSVANQEQGIYSLQRTYASVEQTIPLPNDLDTTKAQALYKDDSLTISIPRLHIAKAVTRKIPIQ